jgi:hypothetical protein
MTSCFASYIVAICRSVVIPAIYVARTSERRFSEKMQSVRLTIAASSRLGALFRELVSRSLREMAIRDVCGES